MTQPLTDKQALDITLKCMKDKALLVVHINVKQAWLIVTWLQLVYRHPGISAPMKNEIRNVAEQFTNAVTISHPEAVSLLAMGWNTNFDRGEELSEDEIDWFNEHRSNGDSEVES